MKHLDTNVLIELTDNESINRPRIRRRIADGEKFACSAISWSEYCNGPFSEPQKQFLLQIIDQTIIPFDREQAELAADLFNKTGRKRSSKSDCMIAASAIHHNAPISTNNLKDFQNFIPHGLLLKSL